MASLKLKYAEAFADASGTNAMVDPDVEPDSEDEEELARSAKRQKIVKRRVLLFGARGLVSRFRHLMMDFRSMLPHNKKEVKFDERNNLYEINEIAEMKNCQTCVFFECRKKRDLFMWLCKTPLGPSIRFQVNNIHTMSELKFQGNCLKGSRPVLIFDKGFEDASKPHLHLAKELLLQVFSVPKGHPKTKPFVDRAVCFYVVDDRIWVRHYQILEDGEKETVKALRRGEDTADLVEIGPRFVLNFVRVFAGSFGGPTLAQNAKYVAPNAKMFARHRQVQQKYKRKVDAKHARKERAGERQMPKDELDGLFA